MHGVYITLYYDDVNMYRKRVWLVLSVCCKKLKVDVIGVVSSSNLHV